MEDKVLTGIENDRIRSYKYGVRIRSADSFSKKFSNKISYGQIWIPELDRYYICIKSSVYILQFTL